MKSRASKGAPVAILGMSYKPDTGVIEESQGVMLARRLSDDGYAVTIHDPMSRLPAQRILGESVTYADSAADALREADIAVIVTPWPEYAQLSNAKLPRNVPVIDCWRILAKDANGSQVKPIWLGYGSAAEVATTS